MYRLSQNLTELTMPPCPRNLRIVFPVATSHRNICRSPPQEANLDTRVQTLKHPPACRGFALPFWPIGRHRMMFESLRMCDSTAVCDSLAVVASNCDVPDVIPMPCTRVVYF